MEYGLLTALVGYAFATSITPGPNNVMLLASGANFGFRRTVPHMLGISLGHAFMVFLVGVGLAQIFKTYPELNTILKVVAVTYMLWLAWKIANAAPVGSSEASGRPFSFFQAAGFQWVNPKAWAMALTAVTLYAPDPSNFSIALVAIVFAMVNLPSVSVWVVLGQQLRRFLNSPTQLRLFNWSMAALLAASLLMGVV